MHGVCTRRVWRKSSSESGRLASTPLSATATYAAATVATDSALPSTPSASSSEYGCQGPSSPARLARACRRHAEARVRRHKPRDALDTSGDSRVGAWRARRVRRVRQAGPPSQHPRHAALPAGAACRTPGVAAQVPWARDEAPARGVLAACWSRCGNIVLRASGCRAARLSRLTSACACTAGLRGCEVWAGAAAEGRAVAAPLRRQSLQLRCAL